MLCVYNISVADCKSGMLSVRSTSRSDALDKDGLDYLYINSGHVNHRLRGSDVNVLSETVHSTSITAVFWSDSERGTSAGRFKLEAICHQTLKLNNN